MISIIKIKCSKCSNDCYSNLKICPYCGYRLTPLFDKFEKIILIFIFILAFITFIITYSFVSKRNNNSNIIPKGSNIANEVLYQDNQNDEQNISTDKENGQIKYKKTYKMNSKEYFNFLSSIAEKIYNNNADIFNSCRTEGYSCTYYRIICYANKEYSEEEFKNRVTAIEDYVFSKLSENNYKNGSIFTCNYDIVQTNIYNKDGNRYYPDYFKDFYMQDFN